MRRLYRLLLKLYPVRFREEFSAPLERQFADDRRDARHAGERARFYLRTLADLVITIPREILREAGQDLRYAARVYRKRAVATALAFGALALAIGATTGVLGVVNALLIRSLPFRQPDRLVEVANPPVSPLGGRADYDAWLANSGFLAGAAAYFPTQMNLAIGPQTSHVQIAEVSANLFDVLGTPAVFGRTFAPGEDRQGRDNVAVISYALWQQYFGGDPRVLGTAIRLNGTPLAVIGVAPPAFDFPRRTAVWTPTVMDYGLLPQDGVFYASMVGRLKTGLPLATANASYSADRATRESLARNRQFARNGLLPDAMIPRLVPLRDQLAGPVRQSSLVLLALVAFALLIACANVAQLLLARVGERRQELAIRGALGASRARLVQQLIVESTLLTTLAAVAGLAVARWTARVAAAAQPVRMAAQDYSALDWRVFAFAILLAALTGLLFGVLPAMLIGRTQTAGDPLRSRAGHGCSGAGRMRTGLLAIQGAVALVLVSGSLVLGRGFLHLVRADLGFRAADVVTLNVSLAGTRWDSENRLAQYYQSALARLRAIPAVQSAAAVQYLPLIDHMYGATGLQLDSGHKVSPVIFNSATPDYFRVMGTPILDGRDFEASDRAGAERVAIVNQEFVSQLGAGPHIVGQRLTALFPKGRTYLIVGVCGSARLHGPSDSFVPQIFLPVDQSPPGFATFVARVQGAAGASLAAARDAVRQAAPEVPIYDVKSLDRRLAEALARPRFYTTAVIFFGVFALLLAVVGTYGAAAYAVTQRTHEMGIRLAVGASPAGLRALLLRQNLAPLAVGVAFGVVAAALFGRYLQSLVAGAEPAGAAACTAAAATLGATAALAVWIATSRIAAIDPTAALRAE